MVQQVAGTPGALLDGTRFKSVLVDGEAALATMLAHIDLNQMRAGIVEDPMFYEWSGSLAGCHFQSHKEPATRCGRGDAVEGEGRGAITVVDFVL